MEALKEVRAFQKRQREKRAAVRAIASSPAVLVHEAYMRATRCQEAYRQARALRDQLKRCDAPLALAAMRRTLHSIEGAVRHAWLMHLRAQRAAEKAGAVVAALPTPCPRCDGTGTDPKDGGDCELCEVAS